ncbi:MAG: response regulator transcription factor, partial [Bacteroidota bacterium]
MEDKIHLLIVEDDAIIRGSLVQYFERDTERFGAVEEFDSVEGLLESPLSRENCLLLLDINLPGMSGLEGIVHIRKKIPGCEIIIVSVLTDSQSIFQAICAGASGYLDKETPLKKIKEALLTLQEGGSPITPSIARKVFDYFQSGNRVEEDLTPREQDIVQGIVDGLSYKLIADRLDVSIDTVRKYIRRVYRKLEVN